jgi:hypothetical protein
LFSALCKSLNIKEIPCPLFLIDGIQITFWGPIGINTENE